MRHILDYVTSKVDSKVGIGRTCDKCGGYKYFFKVDECSPTLASDVAWLRDKFPEFAIYPLTKEELSTEWMVDPLSFPIVTDAKW